MDPLEKPYLIETSPEPCLFEMVMKYYNAHFNHKVALQYTLAYFEKLKETK